MSKIIVCDSIIRKAKFPLAYLDGDPVAKTQPIFHLSKHSTSFNLELNLEGSDLRETSKLDVWKYWASFF